MKKKPRHMFKKTQGFLPEDQADEILRQIMADLRSEQHSEQSSGASKYFFKKAVIACCVLLLLAFFTPGTVAPAPISNVSAAPIANAGSATVNFQVNSLIPLRDVSAHMNDKPVTVTQQSYQGYSVEVEENGYLLLEVETITGMTSSQDILIDSLDDEAPHIVSHEKSGETIIIYLTDGDGTGVDYQNITAYEAITSNPVLPSSVNETDGYISFTYPEDTIYIEIPDKAGNKTTSILEPANTN